MDYKLMTVLMQKAKSRICLDYVHDQRDLSKVYVCYALYWAERQLCASPQYSKRYVELECARVKLQSWIQKSLNINVAENWLIQRGYLPKDWYLNKPHWVPIIQAYRLRWIDQMIELLNKA